MQYLEIEHKFLVDDSFNFLSFDEKLKALNPEVVKQVDVVDTYFVVESLKDHVYRHRFDREIQQLTIKSCSKDPAVRKEVNLSFDGENQIDSVRNFLDASGIIFYLKAQSISLFMFMTFLIVKWFIMKQQTILSLFVVSRLKLKKLLL